MVLAEAAVARVAAVAARANRRPSGIVLVSCLAARASSKFWLLTLEQTVASIRFTPAPRSTSTCLDRSNNQPLVAPQRKVRLSYFIRSSWGAWLAPAASNNNNAIAVQPRATQ